MKTILVCTDFTPAAHNAFAYAAALADAMQAKIVLINVFQQQPVPVSEIPVPVMQEDLRAASDFALHQELLKAGLNLTRIQQPIELVSEGGWPAEEIAAAAQKYKADLVVLGMKGEGKGVRRIFGSTVTGLVSKTAVPMLVVPETAPYKAPDRILLAYEGDTTEEAGDALIAPLLSFSDTFHAQIFLVRVAKDLYSEAFDVLDRPFRLKKMLEPVAPEFENLHGKNVVEALNTFIRQRQIEMVVMLPRKQTLLERFFQRSDTKHMIFESEIPVLVLPDLHK